MSAVTITCAQKNGCSRVSFIDRLRPSIETSHSRPSGVLTFWGASAIASDRIRSRLSVLVLVDDNQF